MSSIPLTPKKIISLPISDVVKQHIIDTMIIPSIEQDISFTIRTRSRWSRIEIVCTTTVYLLMGSVIILSFLSKNNPSLSDWSGVCGIIAVSLKGFASYANLQDHISTVQCNQIINSLGINMDLIDTSQTSYQALSDSTSKGFNLNQISKSNIDIENPLISK